MTYRQRHVINFTVRTTTTTTTTQGLNQVDSRVELLVPLAIAMSVHVDGACGAAMRRRQRRLRGQWRHEQQTVAMVLATVGHHSFGPTAHGAPRSQWTTTSTREGVENETNNVLRHQTTPPPGMRPGRLAEPVPQGFWPGAPRQPGSGVPSLSTPVLADTTVDGVDAGALAFLTGQAVEDARKAEEAKAKEEEEVVAARLEAIEPGVWQRATDADGRTNFWHRLSRRVRWTLPAGASCGGKAKRKKKRRKRTRRSFLTVLSWFTSWHKTGTVMDLFGVSVA